MASDAKLPGVKMWLDGCDERANPLAAGMVNFTMTVSGTADNKETFEKIRTKFNEGFTVHTVEDLKGQMIKVLKEDNHIYEQQIRDLSIQLMNERKAHAALKEQRERELDTLNFFKSAGTRGGDSG